MMCWLSRLAGAHTTTTSASGTTAESSDGVHIRSTGSSPRGLRRTPITRAPRSARAPARDLGADVADADHEPGRPRDLAETARAASARSFCS